MKETKCIFCEITSGQVVIEENGYRGKKCSQCGLIYISPRPSLEEIIDLYGHGDSHITAEAHIDGGFPKRLYARHHLRLLRPHISAGALLEIGAGAGYFLAEARRHGFDPYGLELNPAQADFIRESQQVPCEDAPLNPSIFGSKRFDVVYLSDVISHFYDPISEFRRINQVMKDDGILFLETGNLGEVDRGRLKYVGRFQYPDHLFFFTVDNLKDLLDRTGFRVIRQFRYSIMPQLLIGKGMAGLRDILMRARRKRERYGGVQGAMGKEEASGQTSRRRTSWKTFLINAWEYLIFWVRYRIGAIAVKKGRPQTVIVIAKKRKPVRTSPVST